MKTKLVAETPWLSLYHLTDEERKISYVYSHESRCNGQIVSILPFRVLEDGSKEYLVRQEVTPCWGWQPVISSVTGGVDPGNTPDETVVHEMIEETGYEVTQDEIIKLGTCFGTKSSDTVYFLYAVDLTGKEKAQEPQGDGSSLEAMASNVWVANPWFSRDPHVSAAFVRMQHAGII
jgi:8-oxo-dGTP pyrophosphatase MutT (NUDIX family)